MNLDPTQDYNVTVGDTITITSGDFTLKMTSNLDGSTDIIAWVIGTEPGGIETAYGGWHLENKSK